jgi:hypothetical protein
MILLLNEILGYCSYRWLKFNFATRVHDPQHFGALLRGSVESGMFHAKRRSGDEKFPTYRGGIDGPRRDAHWPNIL